MGLTKPPVHIRTVQVPLVFVVVLAVIVAGAVFGALYLSGIIQQKPACGLGCETLSYRVGNPYVVTPGQGGCQSRTGEVCYGLDFETWISEGQLSALKFSLNTSNGAFVPTGEGAHVTVFDPAGDVVGLWNWSSATWHLGETWPIPVDQNITLTFDSGLQTTDLKYDFLFIWMSPPIGDAVGVGL